LVECNSVTKSVERETVAVPPKSPQVVNPDSVAAPPPTVIPPQAIAPPIIPTVVTDPVSSNSSANLKAVVVPVTQLADIILDQLPAALASGPVTMRLQLDTPAAGMVDLRLSTTRSSINAQITVQGEQTQARMAEILPGLIERLKDAGVEVHTLTVASAAESPSMELLPQLRVNAAPVVPQGLAGWLRPMRSSLRRSRVDVEA
jgi:hypothetical protein